MPYIILLIGILIGLYALYRFFLNANITQIKALFLTAFILTVVVATFLLAMTGRLPAAIALAAALVPTIIGILRAKKPEAPSVSRDQSIQSRTDALKVLNLENDASEADIKAAYKKLMQKVHPDQDGSEWMAAKLNEARDFLLKD